MEILKNYQKLESDFNFSWTNLKSYDPKLQREKAILNQKSNNIKSRYDEIYMNNVAADEDPLFINTKPLFDNINYNMNYFRKLIILVDMSETLNSTDFKPNRQKYLFDKLEGFIVNFFKNNFISYISIIQITDYIAHIVSPFLEDSSQLINLLNSKSEVLGLCSLQNGLNKCKELLEKDDKFSYEIALFYSSPNSIDKYRLDIDYFVRSKIEINIFSFELPFYALNLLATSTKGIIITSSENSNIDLEFFLNYLIYKKTRGIRNKSEFYVSYPQREKSNIGVMCICHNTFCLFYYSCEKCKLKYCKLPSLCSTCNLVLMNSQFFLQNKNSASIGIKEENYLPFSTIVSSIKNKSMEFFNNYPSLKFLLSLHNEIDIAMEDSSEVNLQNGNHSKPINSLSNINILGSIKQNCKHVSKIMCLNTTEDHNNYLKNNPQCDGCNILLSVQVFENPSSIFLCITCFYVLCNDCKEFLIKNRIGCLNCNI